MEENEKENQEIQKAVKDLYDLQADYYIQRDKCGKYIDAIDKILGIEHTPANNLIKKQQNTIDEQDKIIKEKDKYIETYLGNITLADKRQTLVEVIEDAKNDLISQRWNMLYKEFGKKYHMNIFLRTENYRKRTGNKKFRYLDYIEKELNMLSELYDLALALYHSDANKLIEKKYYLNNATKNKLSLSNLN